MLLHNEHTVLMSPADSKLIEGIKQIGVNVIFSDRINTLRANEQYHADMQLLTIGDTAFIPCNCSELRNTAKKYFENVVICRDITDPYPNNVALNAALVGNKLFCKESALAAEVKRYCTEKGIAIINVNQGYTKCSTLVVNDNAIITADDTIYNASIKSGVRALKIRAGHIELQDADYGFIGGCSGKVGEYLVFFGDVQKHPDGNKVVDFITAEGIKYVCISDNTLCDIGGLVELNKQI